MGVRVVLDVGHIGDHKHAEFVPQIVETHTDAQVGLVKSGAEVNILLPVVAAQQVERELD